MSRRVEKKTIRLFSFRSFFCPRRSQVGSRNGAAAAEWSGVRLVVALCALSKEGKKSRVRERERKSGATKAAQPLWTFVSITHRLGEVSPRRRTAVILAQILSR